MLSTKLIQHYVVCYALVIPALVGCNALVISTHSPQIEIDSTFGCLCYDRTKHMAQN